MQSDNSQTKPTVAVNGNVEDSNIVIGNNNSITILPKKETQKRNSQLKNKNNKTNPKKQLRPSPVSSSSHKIIQKGNKNLYVENNSGTINIED